HPGAEVLFVLAKLLGLRLESTGFRRQERDTCRVQNSLGNQTEEHSSLREDLTECRSGSRLALAQFGQRRPRNWNRKSKPVIEVYNGVLFVVIELDSLTVTTGRDLDHVTVAIDISSAGNDHKVSSHCVFVDLLAQCIWIARKRITALQQRFRLHFAKNGVQVRYIRIELKAFGDLDRLFHCVASPNEIGRNFVGARKQADAEARLIETLRKPQFEHLFCWLLRCRFFLLFSAAPCVLRVGSHRVSDRSDWLCH